MDVFVRREDLSSTKNESSVKNKIPSVNESRVNNRPSKRKKRDQLMKEI